MLGANVMWGLMSPLAKFVMGTGGVTPMTITGLRVAGAMVLFWTASLFGQRERVASADMLKLFAASLLAIVFNQGCFIFGVGLSSPVDASVITTSMPLLAMVFAALYLKEPVSGKKVGGIAAAGYDGNVKGRQRIQQTGRQRQINKRGYCLAVCLFNCNL